MVFGAEELRRRGMVEGPESFERLVLRVLESFPESAVVDDPAEEFSPGSGKRSSAGARTCLPGGREGKTWWTP